MKISFNFHQSYTREMVSGLKADRFDVIFGSYVENEPDIQFVPILNQEMIVITPLGHPLAGKTGPVLRDLEDYPVMGYDRTSGLGGFTNRIYSSYSMSPTSSASPRMRMQLQPWWRKISGSRSWRTWISWTISNWKRYA